MNKSQLQSNNAELQTIINAVQSLPTSKPWGGGTTIKPSSEDILIPAFTNVDLTVAGVDLSDFGVKRGTTQVGTYSNLIEIDIGMEDYTVFAMYGGAPADASNSCIARQVLCINTNYIPYNSIVYGVETYATGVMSNNEFFSEITHSRIQPNGTILKIELSYFYSSDHKYIAPIFTGEYHWIAVK